jgi:hypothetical protein
MAATLLTSGQGTGASNTTASISPAANSLVVAIVASTRTAGNPNNPTLSFNSVDKPRQFTQVGASDNQIKIHVFPFLAGSSPASTTCVIDFIGQSQTNTMWAIIQVTGNTQDLPLQYVGNDSISSATGLSVTLAAFGNPSNVTLAAIYDKATKSITAKAAFIELSNQQSTGTLETEYFGSPDTSPNWTWASSSEHVTALAMEIKIGSTGLLLGGEI